MQRHQKDNMSQVLAKDCVLVPCSFSDNCRTYSTDPGDVSILHDRYEMDMKYQWIKQLLKKHYYSLEKTDQYIRYGIFYIKYRNLL